jgi:tungstate transport system ATP-binding protein
MTYRVEKLRHTYGDRTVLDIPALEVREGEMLALVGPSGAGKSTLLRLLALLETPAEGRVCLRLDGVETDGSSASLEARRRVAMVFQRPLLLNRSVAANVAYGLKLRAENSVTVRVEEALGRVGLGDYARAHARTLSGGELQRVALARALVLDPKVLLLDEPTANLDPYNVGLIEDLVREQNAAHGATVVIATHNVFQARRLADRVGLLLEGRLVEVADTRRFFEESEDPRTGAFVRGDYVY